jgi:hypothetical protein
MNLRDPFEHNDLGDFGGAVAWPSNFALRA